MKKRGLVKGGVHVRREVYLAPKKGDFRNRPINNDTGSHDGTGENIDTLILMFSHAHAHMLVLQTLRFAYYIMYVVRGSGAH